MTSALTEQQQALLDWLVELADANRPCPTGREIAGKIGLSGDGAASMLLTSLEAAGPVFVERYANWRIVTILASGKQLRSAGAPPADRMPTTIGRPNLGAGEKRKPAENVIGRVAVGAGIGEPKALDEMVRDEEPGASPDGDEPDITIGTDTVLASGIDDPARKLWTKGKASEHVDHVGSAPLGRVPDDQGHEQPREPDPAIGDSLDREGELERADDRDGQGGRAMDPRLEPANRPMPAAPNHSSPSTCASPDSDRFAEYPALAERTLRILERSCTTIDSELVSQIWSLVIDAGHEAAKAAITPNENMFF